MKEGWGGGGGGGEAKPDRLRWIAPRQKHASHPPLPPPPPWLRDEANIYLLTTKSKRVPKGKLACKYV